MRALRVSPSTYSNTMYGWPSSSPASITVTTCGCDSRATARASRRKRSCWSGSSESDRCMSLIATQRSRVSSKARYTVDIPPEPIRSSRRKRPLSRVPITVVYFARDAGASPLLHRPRVLLVMGRGAVRAPAHVGIRRVALVHLGHGRTRPRLYEPQRRLRLAARPLARGGGRDAHADRPSAVEGGADRQHLSGLHGGQGGPGAGGRRWLPLPANGARGP